MKTSNNKLLHKLRTLTVYLWASPISLIGLALGVLALAGGCRLSVKGGVLECTGGRILPLFLSALGLRMQVQAITFGHVVLARSNEAMQALREHERIHVKQYERWGLLFLLLYFGSSLLAFFQGKDPYYDNQFEKAAFDGAVKHAIQHQKRN